MKMFYNNCECLEKLMYYGKVKPFTHNYDLSIMSDEPEVGTLCLVNNVVENIGHMENNKWVVKKEVKEELFPINYCPICGKEIMYKTLSDDMIHRLTKNS